MKIARSCLDAVLDGIETLAADPVGTGWAAVSGVVLAVVFAAWLGVSA